MSAGDEVLVRVEGVSKKFCRDLRLSLKYGMHDLTAEVFGRPRTHDLRPKEFWAIQDVGFELRRGECLGLIGRNGAGKTTLLRMLNGLIKPDHGRIEMHGRIGALIALGSGFNPVLSGRENIHVNGSVLGLTKAEIEERMDEIIDFAEIRDFIDSPVQSYSSGMNVRLGFAVATALDPDVLILDEVLAVGDAAFRAKCYRRISELRKQAAVIFVSHNMEQVARICNRTLVMAKGKVLQMGSVEQGIEAYERLNEQGIGGDASFLQIEDPVTNWHVELSTDNLVSGATLTVQIELECSKPIPGATFRMLIYNSMGTCVGDCNLPAHEYAVVVGEGRMSWELSIASLPLKSGRYDVSFGLLDAHGDLLVWSHKRQRLTVVGSHPAAQADMQILIAQWADHSSTHVSIPGTHDRS